jgi:hypothetical protein
VFLVILYDVNPALLEAVAERSTKGINSPQFVTCPNEMVALSCAQGYAQVTGKPAAVIVHVDCGTQALAGAVHNVDRCRTPVSGGIFPTEMDWFLHVMPTGSQLTYNVTVSLLRSLFRSSSMLARLLTLSTAKSRALESESSMRDTSHTLYRAAVTQSTKRTIYPLQ